ncbi:sensor histidine kinase [Vibrio sp. MEBiC08052]|uniref:sensor histidine kinase n=1 Tax=Vibrio sp. MEBiC08052 TaxID=1761910 RepID=UPI00074087DC|nr:sensor histidine kinase [Vibrio sp. MEBiC08052]KUI99751.1 DctB [Vibrio sp. MEBiC08052]
MLSKFRFNLIFVVIFIVTTAYGAHLVWQYSYQSLLSEHQAQLERFASHVVTKLDKFAHIPRLLAKDKKLVDALTIADNSAQIDITNHYLEQVNDAIKASDTYLLDIHGNTIAASNWNLTRSFIGRNFNWRPYFQVAVQGNESQYYALGSTSGERGYYYAYPVTYAATILGVVVVKMDLSSIEENWKSQNSYFVATDPYNIIFMSSQPNWLFKSVTFIDPEIRAKIFHSRQYLDQTIQSLGLLGKMDQTTTEWINPKQGWIKGDFIVSSRPLKNIPLNIRVLSPKIQVFWSSFGFVVISCMVFAIIYLIMQLVHHRKNKQRQIEQLQSEAKQKLEFLVMERTAKLHLEIEERSKTEQRLRQTQDELIQAAKLAVLGQMSASISHELNNPLAAIRSFADNGRRFIASGKIDRADENLTRISGLTERMAKISTQLRSFARKSDHDERAVVQLYPIILSTKELIQSQIKSNLIHFEIQTPEQPIWLNINPIHLEQVLINLLTNAIQALDDRADKQIILSFTEDNLQLTIHIDDNGEGLGDKTLSQLFDPFYTTKKNGLGLGLSISQQIIQSMGGQLNASSSPLGGARFSIQLPATSPPSPETAS